MRTLALTLAALPVLFLTTGTCLAQHRTGLASGFGNVVFPGTGRAPRFGSGFGNVVFPGTGGPPGNITNPGFARGLGGAVSGFRPYGSNLRGRFNGGGFGSGYVYVPYAYPMYMGGMDSSYASPQQPNVTVLYPPPQPPVVINQNFGAAPAQPQVQEVGPPDANADTSGIKVYNGPSTAPPAPAQASEQPADSQPTYYLIAFKDHSIYSAVAYWVDGDTLHYFTPGNTHNQVSLSLVDRPLTEQLNRERNVAVRLPVNQ